MNLNNAISHRRKSSISELKAVLNEVIKNQYENKVKKLQKPRSPGLRKQKTHSKSKSTLNNYNRNLNSKQDVTSTDTENLTKSPEIHHLEESLKTLRAENIELKQKLASIKGDYELLIVEIRGQLEQDKELQLDALSNFYLEKLSVCEKKFESQFKEQLLAERAKIKEEAKRKYERTLKDLIEDKEKGDVFIEKILKIDSNLEAGEVDSSFDLEHRFRLVLESKNSEFDRKLQISTQELSKLRKENESLKSKIVELQAKLDASVHSNSDVSAGLLNKYSDTLQEGSVVKREIEKKQNMCVKCKAVIQTNTELSRKILRIREFLSN